MNAVQPTVPAGASSAQPAMSIATPVPAVATAAAPANEALVATPFLRWLADADGASTAHDDALLPAVEAPEPTSVEGAASPAAWPAAGAPDGLVRLGASLSAAVPLPSSGTSKAVVETTPASDEPAADLAQAAALPVPLASTLPPVVPSISPTVIATALPAAAVPVVAATPTAATPSPAVAATAARVVAMPLTVVAQPAKPVDDDTADSNASGSTAGDRPTPREAGVALAAPRAAATLSVDTPLPAKPAALAIAPSLNATDSPAITPRNSLLAALLAPPAATPTHDALDPITAAATNTPLTAPPAPTPDAPSVKLPATPPAAWQAPLLDALGDHVRLQLAQRGEQAVIRLDPPSLGTIDIVLRHEAGVLQVQLSASHTEVQRQLLHIADSLRQDLSQRQYSDVSVQVASSSTGDSDGRQRQAQRQQTERKARPGRALANDDAAPRFTLSTTAE